MKNCMNCSVKKRSDIKVIFLLAVLFSVLSIFLSLCLGSVRISFMELWDAVQNGADSGVSGRIFWYARLPRTFACMLAGAGLAVSGVIIQNVLANHLASPGIIGVNAGAGLSVTICCACGLLSGWAIAFAAFFGSLFAVLLVAFTAQKVGASKSTVIMGGVAVNSFLTALSEAITTLVPEAGVQTADFRVGGFSAVAYTRLIPAGILIAAGLFFVFTLSNELDVMALGEDMAQGLGLSVKKMRTLFLGLAAMLAGASVSFAGLLGFVGLIVPHIARKFVGSENRYLLPFSAILGGTFVTFCDLIARTAFSPYELPVGILLSFIGGPFFIFLLLKRRRCL